VKRLRDFFGSFGGHRPPTGPLTTDEASDADDLEKETLAEAEKQREGKQAGEDGEAARH
jgi:hypothetical protein